MYLYLIREALSIRLPVRRPAFSAAIFAQLGGNISVEADSWDLSYITNWYSLMALFNAKVSETETEAEAVAEALAEAEAEASKTEHVDGT